MNSTWAIFAFAKVKRSARKRRPRPDAIWDEAARHYAEPELAILVLNIAMINFWNRLNVTTRQMAGEWLKSVQGQSWSKQKSAESPGSTRRRADL
jgi:hypothetical protein